MNDISEERPDYFEGEYLGADDLQQLVVYMRDQAQRHALGGHVWGIAAGLELLEQDSPSGGTDVYLLPGYAIDGYGRAIVVVNPLRLTLDLFTGLPTGLTPLWIRYDEGGTKGTRPGFEVCCTPDSYARTAESYALVAGTFDDVTQMQSGITVGGVAVVDARTAAQTFDDAAPLYCDASIPYQNLPLADEEKSQWLIPIGLVSWKAGVPGSIVALTPSDRLLSRRQRRYLGVVAETLVAADGLIRLRRRDMPFDSTKTVDDQCGPDELSDDAHTSDLAVCAAGNIDFNELVWIEGRLRLTDDARLFGGRLEFRDAKGLDYLPSGLNPGAVPLFFDRVDVYDSGGKEVSADLRLNIGAAVGGTNRFVISQAASATADPDPCNKVTFTNTTRVVVQDDGKVGIGTETPDQLLTIESTDGAFLHVGTTTGPHDIYVGADAGDSAASPPVAGGGVIAALQTDSLIFRTGGAAPDDDAFTRMVVQSDGEVVIGKTDSKVNPLVTLQTKSSTWLVATIADNPSDPSFKMHELKIGASSDGAAVSASADNDDLQLRAGGNAASDTKVWIKTNGKMGVGTDSPDYVVTAVGSSTAHVGAQTSGGSRKIKMGVNSDGAEIDVVTKHDLFVKTDDTTRMTVTKEGKVGIGTTDPQNELDVRGAIRLGSAGDMQAPGAKDMLRIIAGKVKSNGDRKIDNAGFDSSWQGPPDNRYVVTFDDDFTENPVVVATPVRDTADVVAVVSFIGTGSFHVRIGGTVDQTEFTFLVFGRR